MTIDAAMKQINDFLVAETRQLPGQVSFSIGNLRNATMIQSCQQLEVQKPSGARPYGRTSVTLRCTKGQQWQMSVPVQIKVLGNIVVSKRLLTAGQLIAAEDLTEQTADLGELPPGVITDATLIIGRVARATISPARYIRQDAVKTQELIRIGQTVKIVSKGPGFEVSNDGAALTAGGVGDLIKAKLSTGQIVTGKATAEGLVEVRF